MIYYRNRLSYICKTATPIELKFCGDLPVGPGMVLGYKFSRYIHRFIGFPEKPVFTVVYITLYYRNKMLSICETTKPTQLKFCGKLPVGLWMVLG